MKAVVTLRRLYPDLPIMARASDAEHQNRLINTLGVSAMTPKLPMVRRDAPPSYLDLTSYLIDFSLSRLGFHVVKFALWRCSSLLAWV